MLSCNNLIVLMAVAFTGCASVRPSPVKITPPPELLQDCQEPEQAIKTNGELVGYALSLRDALRGCNRDKQALREWAEEGK